MGRAYSAYSLSQLLSDVMSATVSAIIIAHEPTYHLRELCRSLQPSVDQIILAIDDRNDVSKFTYLRRYVDRFITFTFRGFIEHNLSIFGMAETDYSIRFDSDEFPSHQLLSDIRSIRNSGSSLMGYITPRKWLVGSGLEYIQTFPWYPDLQCRIVRTQSRLTRWPLELHEPLIPEGEIGILEGCIYHLDLIWNSLEQRLAKSSLYRTHREVLIDGQMETSQTFYLPEQVDHIETAKVEIQDLGTALKAAGTHSKSLVSKRYLTMKLRRQATPSSFNYRSPNTVNNSTLAGRIVSVCRSHCDNDSVSYLISAENLSDWVWPKYFGGRGVAVGAFAEEDNGNRIDIGRGHFSDIVLPGGIGHCLLSVPSSNTSASRIVINLVDEGRSWFDDTSSLEISLLGR